MSAFENITGLTDALTVANNITDGLLVLGFPMLVWVAVFSYYLPTNGRGNAMTGASFVSLIIVFMLNMVGLIEYWMIVANLMLFAVSAAMMMLERRE